MSLCWSPYKGIAADRKCCIHSLCDTRGTIELGECLSIMYSCELPFNLFLFFIQRRPHSSIFEDERASQIITFYLYKQHTPLFIKENADAGVNTSIVYVIERDRCHIEICYCSLRLIIHV